jgi:glyoxylase I family protein
MRTNFSHFGICVSDLDLSLRFYCEALGFEKAETHTIGDDFAALMEVEHVDLVSQFIRRGETAIELLSFANPTPIGESERRPINQLGLTHLSFRVDDLAHTASQIERLGGRIIAPTKTVLPFGEMDLEFIYCTDPDGVRIELMNLGPL